MSNRELEDRQEQQLIAWVASELDLTVDELCELDFDLDAIDGNDGAVYGHRVTFAEGADPEVLSRIVGLQDGRWINIGFPPDEPEPEDDEL